MRFRGLRTHEAWRVKQYSIAAGDSFDESAFEECWRIASGALPLPATDDRRPGIGFVIHHEGATARYFVLCWWDNENELPIRVWVQPTDGSSAWRRAGERESVCVWDLEIIESERRAYIEHVLARGSQPDLDAYLAHDATKQAAGGLAMKDACQTCARPLSPDGEAQICSYECTFCPECAQRTQGRCPNCRGELVARPRRIMRDSG